MQQQKQQQQQQLYMILDLPTKSKIGVIEKVFKRVGF